jgi:ATP-dependent Clp protease ATP-binding subunit ClpX
VCSFCRKPESEVQRLIGGANASICDACVGICNKILDATPVPFAGWEKMRNDQLLQSLKPAEQAMEGVRSVLQEQVGILRKRDVSWAEIGEALGISRQAAWQRFS